MKFYVLKDFSGGVDGCFTSKKAAIHCFNTIYSNRSCEIDELEIKVDAESIRRILAGEGYATEQKTIASNMDK